MSTERIIDPDGRVIDRQIKPDHQRELVVATVTSLNPPTVEVFGNEWPIHARIEGVTVQVGDKVLTCRVEQGQIAIGKIEVL